MSDQLIYHNYTTFSTFVCELNSASAKLAVCIGFDQDTNAKICTVQTITKDHLIHLLKACIVALENEPNSPIIKL